MGNIIFFEWFESNGVEDKEYPKVILEDSINTGRVRYYNLAREAQNKGIINMYKRMCKENSKISYLLTDILIATKKICRGDVVCFNEFNPFLVNGYIKRIRIKYGVKAVLVIRNKFPNKLYPCVRSGYLLSDLKKEFDLIVTDEKEDADQFGLVFAPDSICTSCFDRSMCDGFQKDLLFIGSDNRREGILRKLAKSALENKVDADIMVTGKKRDTSLIKYINYLDYTDVLKKDVEANCILEILQPGQTSYTLRYQEAVVLGKKLLTNNKSVLFEKYYDQRYIQVFDDVEKIDWEFVREKLNVNYSYDGDFSSERFFDIIEENLERINND